MFLTDEQVQHLTGRERPSAQRRVLDTLEIEYTRDADGRPVVLASSVDKTFQPPQNEEPQLVLVNRG